MIIQIAIGILLGFILIKILPILLLFIKEVGIYIYDKLSDIFSVYHWQGCLTLFIVFIVWLLLSIMGMLQ